MSMFRLFISPGHSVKEVESLVIITGNHSIQLLVGRNRRASPSASEAVTTAGTPPATIQAAFVSPATPPAHTKPAWSTPPRPPILQAALQPHPARPGWRRHQWRPARAGH